MLRFPVSSPAEAFQKAIEIARRQQVKSLELRAANEPCSPVAALRQAR
jgi:hypothetical protein